MSSAVLPAAPATSGAAALLRWLPSPLATYCAALAAVMAVIVVARGLADADYFWHVTTGELIAETGRVPVADVFSFTWAGRPWTAHEWLGELLMYLLVAIGGGPAVTLVFGAVAAAAFVVLAVAVHRLGVPVPAIAAACTLGAYVVTTYATVRPQVLSWLFLAGLLAILMAADDRRPRRILFAAPLFVLWANVHGLWVVGLGVFGVYLLFTLIGRTQMRGARRWVAAAFAGACLASVLTPSGLDGALYPLRYVGSSDWWMRYVEEWRSPNFHELRHFGLLALILAVVANGGRATPGWLQALSYLGVVMALVATRNAPVAAVLSVPTLAMGLADRWASRAARAGRRVRRTPRGDRESVVRRAMELGFAAAIVATAALVVPRLPVAASDASFARQFPVAGTDVLERVDPDTRVLTEYGWGGYVIWRLYDAGGRVFVDGRGDMYDPAILEDYVSIRSADEGWQRLLDRYGVDALLVQPDAVVVRGPAQAAGWCELHRDAVQVLLRRCAHQRDGAASAGTSVRVPVRGRTA